MLKYILPRLRDILFLAVFLGAFLLGPRMLSLDSDLGRHLTLGNYILEERDIPTTDILSHTKSGEPRPAYEWLTQVLFALANRVAGLDGVILVCALTIAVAFALVYADAARRSALPLTALIVTMSAVAASSLHWLPRPHVITFLFLAIWIERLERMRRGEDVPLWQFPALMLFWVNAHGGFLFGALAWVAYFGGWALSVIARVRPKQSPLAVEGLPDREEHPARNDGGGKQFLLIGATSLLATFVAPSGWGNWQAVLNNNNRFLLSHTIETMPPDFAQAGMWPFALLLILVVVLCFATRKTTPFAHFFLLGGFSLLGLLMARNIPLFAIAAAPVLAERLADFLQTMQRWRKIEANIAKLERPLRGALWPVVVCGGIALALAGRFGVRQEATARFDANVFPVAATDWLVEHPQSGNMFNEFNWGGYLLYRLWPDQKVYLDSQTDFYGEEFMREYEQILTAQGDWQPALDRRAVTWAILPSDAPLASSLRDAGWLPLYFDSTAIIFRHP
jgi:hypothetical protein